MHHQTSLTADQAHVTSDGLIHLVVSERDPGPANWDETQGRREGAMQFRWPRVGEPFTPELGPSVKVVPFERPAGYRVPER